MCLTASHPDTILAASRGGGPPGVPPVSQRAAWVDCAKGIGIILVVYGHTVRGLVDAGVQPRTGWPVTLADLIYTFHMPLFFFLSGLWIARSLERPLHRFLLDRAGTILYPYLLWSALQYAVNLAAARWTNAAPQSGLLLKLAYQPYAQFWFLYVLFLDVAQVALLLRVRSSPPFLLLVAGALYACNPMLSGIGWRPASQIATSLPFVVAGTLLGPSLIRSFNGISARLGGCFSALSLASLAVVFSAPDQPLLYLVAAGFGIAAVVFASLATWHTRVGSVLQSLGRRSLEIFVAHVLATAGARIVLIKFSGVPSSGVHLSVGLFAGLLFPLALASLAGQFGMNWLFTLNLKSSGGGRRPPLNRPAYDDLTPEKCVETALP